MYKILIIEDDQGIAEGIQTRCQSWGFEVQCVKDFKDVLHTFVSFHPHLVLLDITLPFYDGFYWCGKIREKSSCPIIFLSSRNADSDQVYAMMNGGDDYVTKPFSLDVLTAKVTAILRRTYGEYVTAVTNDLSCGDCSFSQNRLVLRCNGKETELSKTEAGVIRIMFQNYPDVVSREDLLNEIWDNDNFVEENTLNVTISRIRKRLDGIGSTLNIKPVRGIGYRLGDDGDEK